MAYWDEFQKFLSKLGSTVSNIAVPFKGTAETSISATDQLRHKGDELYWKAVKAPTSEERKKYYQEAIKYFQQSSALAQQTQKDISRVTTIVSKIPEVTGFAIGGAIGGAIGSATKIATKPLVSSQMEEVEKARAQLAVNFYRQRYPEAIVPSDASIFEQEKFYKEYAATKSKEKVSEEEIRANPKSNIFLKTVQASWGNIVKTGLTRGVAQIAEEIGLPEVSAPLFEKAEQFSKQAEIFAKKAEIPDIDEVFKKVKQNPAEGIPEAIGYFTGQALPYMLAIMAGGVALRKLPIKGGALTNYLIIRGNLQKDLEDGGIPRDKAADYASLGAWIEAQLEEGIGIAPDKLARWFTTGSKEALKNSFRQFLTKLPYSTIKYFATLAEEGGEEVLQNWTETFIKKWLKSEETKNLTIPEIARQSVIEFIGGMAGAIPFGAGEIMMEEEKAGLSIKDISLPEFRKYYNYHDLYGNLFKGVIEKEGKFKVQYYNPATQSILEMPFRTKERALRYVEESFRFPPSDKQQEKKLEQKYATQQTIIDQLEKARAERVKIGQLLEQLREKGKANTPEYENASAKYDELGDKIHELTLQLEPAQPAEPTPSPATEITRKELMYVAPEITPPAKVLETTEPIALYPPKQIREVAETPPTPPIPQSPTAEAVSEPSDEYKISVAKSRIAELEGIDLTELTPYKVQHFKPIWENTETFYNSLTEEQVKDYLLNPEKLPTNISANYFVNLAIENIKKPEVIILALNSTPIESLTVSAQQLVEQRNILHSSPLGWYMEAQQVKQQKIEEVYHKKAVEVVEEASEKLLKDIQKSLEEGVSVGNPKLYEAFASGKLNIWELSTASYEVKVKLLTPYFSDPFALRQAALELEGKQFLKNVERGLKNWIDKYSQANRYSPEKVEELQKMKEEFLKEHGEQLQNLKNRKKLIRTFAKTITGYTLSPAEIEELMAIVDVITQATSHPDFLTLPPSHPLIKQFATARIDYEHFLLKIKGAYQSLGQWAEELTESVKNAPTSQDKILTIARVLNDIFISLKAQLDNSFILRQGMHTLFRDPPAWLAGVKNSFAGIFSKINEKNHLQSVDSIFHEYYSSYLYRNGFYDNARVKISYAELYPTDVPAKIPVMGEAFKRSQAAYTLAQFTMRRKIADTIWNKLQGAKIGDRTIDFLNNKEDIKQLRYMVNAATASGFQIKRGLFDFVVWSKNIILADFRTLVDATYFLTEGKGPFKRDNFIKAWREILGRFILFAIINAILRFKYKDADKEPPFIIDPTDQRFGTIYFPGGAGRIGNPLLKLIHIIAILATGSYKSATTRKRHYIWAEPGPEVMDFLWSYFEGKFTPGLSVLVQIINRRNFRGEKITPARVATGLVAPISIENLLETRNVEEQNKFWAIVGAVADLFGLSSYTSIRQIKFDPIIRGEIDRLQQAGYEKLQSKGRYDGFINEFEYLSPEENQKFFKGLTKITNLVLKKVTSSPTYQKLDDETKAELLAYAIDKSYELTRYLYVAKLLKERKDWSDEKLYNWIIQQRKTGLITKEMIKPLVQAGLIRPSVILYGKKQKEKK